MTVQEKARELTGSLGSPEREEKNQAAAQKTPGTPLSKVQDEHLELILSTILQVIPTVDEDGRFYLNRWGTGLVAVGVGGLTEGEQTEMFQALRDVIRGQNLNPANSFDRQRVGIWIHDIFRLRPRGECPTWEELEEL